MAIQFVKTHQLLLNLGKIAPPMHMTIVAENWKRGIGIASTMAIQYVITLPDSM